MRADAFAPIGFHDLAGKGFDWRIANTPMGFHDSLGKESDWWIEKSGRRHGFAAHACTCTANTCSGPRIYRVCTHIRGTSTLWQSRARPARVAPRTRICSSLPAQSEHFRHRYCNPLIRSFSHRIVKSHWCICNPPIKSFSRQFVKSDWCECICPHSHQSHSARLAGPSVGTLRFDTVVLSAPP